MSKKNSNYMERFKLWLANAKSEVKDVQREVVSFNRRAKRAGRVVELQRLNIDEAIKDHNKWRKKNGYKLIKG